MTLFIGLDTETTGSDILNGAKIIQVGFTIRTSEGGIATFTQGICPAGVREGWEPEAEAVHGIPLETVLNGDDFFNAEDVDKWSYEWLVENGVDRKVRHNNIPVGLNVSGFDMPFIRKWLPQTYSLFSRRTADLNAMFFALDGCNNASWEQWKKWAKEYADKELETRGPKQEHNAGWDSAMHLYMLEFVQKQIRRGLDDAYHCHATHSAELASRP